MKLVKCPRCDLNYITENEKYCKVCLREMKGDSRRDETELCSICNVEPALPGRDVCIFCLKEMNGANAAGQDDDAEERISSADLTAMDSVSTMEEIVPEIDDDIPGEMAESLEKIRDDEENSDEDEDSDEDEL